MAFNHLDNLTAVLQLRVTALPIDVEENLITWTAFFIKHCLEPALPNDLN